jgi:hypothetical protein
MESEAALFDPPEALKVLGPTHFPPPTAKFRSSTSSADGSSNNNNNNNEHDVQVLLQPVMGRHRPHQDVVVAYAEGYRLANYIWFLQSLTQTGFRGDVVLAIATDNVLQPDVKEYLQTYTFDTTEIGEEEEKEEYSTSERDKPSVIVYQIPLYCENTDNSNHQRSMNKRSHELDIFQMCRFDKGVYGWKNDNGETIQTAEDPRHGRTVATLRYEWYWMVSLHYHKHSWILLLDARDAYFQTNPFVNLPREPESNSHRPDGLLYFFGENANATRLGISKKNRNWLTRGYGDAVIDILKDYPTICSGSTMGEQVAIETYLRAMVNEHDECEVRMTGSDQGFHNVRRRIRCSTYQQLRERERVVLLCQCGRVYLVLCNGRILGFLTPCLVVVPIEKQNSTCITVKNSIKLPQFGGLLYGNKVGG